MTRFALPSAAAAVFALATAGCERPTPDAADPAPEATTAEHAAESAAPSGSGDADVAAPMRLVTLSGGVTETVAALGLADAIVAVDASSVFPAEVTELPQLGYHRALSAEGIASAQPSLIIGTVDDGPPPVVAQLESMDATYARTDEVVSLDDAYGRIRQIADLLDLESEGEALVGTVQAAVSEAQARIPAGADAPSAVLVYARGHGTLFVGGGDTIAETLISAAGGANAASEIDGFAPLTPESLVAAQPAFIIMSTRGIESVGGVDGLLQVPGVAATPAGQNRAVVVVDDGVLLSMGPRVGEAVAALVAAFHGSDDA